MNLLLIGGTQFLGRHLAEAALARQHQVTIFHRGRHPWRGAGQVEELYGDRHADLSPLRHRRWDAVLDTCGYLPSAVRASVAALRGAAAYYGFISSVAAYADASQPNYDETAPLAELAPAQAAAVAALGPPGSLTAAALGDAYGALKAQCEREVQQGFGARALLVRAGVLVGPLDPTDRFTYWVSRLGRGGEVLAPGRPGRAVQFIDARDVASWVIGMAERGVGGAYNVASPAGSLSFGQLLAAINALSPCPATLTWVSEAFLRQQAVAEWSELPLYLAEAHAETRGFLAANVGKALREHLRLRPLSATIGDTLAWRAQEARPLQAGLAEARERVLLSRWHAQRAG